MKSNAEMQFIFAVYSSCVSFSAQHLNPWKHPYKARFDEDIKLYIESFYVAHERWMKPNEVEN